MPVSRAIPLALLATVLAAPSAPAQRSSRATIATTPQPIRIVLERTDLEWCFDEVRARVDLSAPVDRRVGMRVSLRVSPRGVVEVPGGVVARPWASFTIRGKHSLEVPAPMTPRVTTVTLVAEAKGGTASESFTIRSGPRARRECRDKIERAEAYERSRDVNQALIDSENEQASRKKGKAARNPR